MLCIGFVWEGLWEGCLNSAFSVFFAMSSALIYSSFLPDPVIFLAKKLLLKTGMVDSLNMKNGSLLPVSGGAAAGMGMSAAKSLQRGICCEQT